MGNGHNKIIISIILLVGIAVLFPSQQGYGSSVLSPELNEKQTPELYKEQLVKAEQARDKIFVLQKLQNPYLDTPPNVISFEENNEKKSLKNYDRTSENFQLIKDEQISIAEKKYKEILGGKTISNPINNESNKKSIHGLKIDNQLVALNRDSDDFENYRLLQISIAKQVRDNNWKENHWESNPYQNDNHILPDDVGFFPLDEPRISPPDFLSNQILTFRHIFDNSEIKVKVQTDKVQQLLDGVSTMNVRLVDQVTGTDDIGVISSSKAIKRIFAMNMLSDNKNQISDISLKQKTQENQISNMPLKRQNEEFNNLVIKQISLAENMRNEMAEFKMSYNSNPYLNENTDESLDKTSKNDIATNQSVLINEFKSHRLDRGTEEFKIAKEKELQIAQNTLNEMLLLPNPDVGIANSFNVSDEKLNNFGHDDLDLEIIKNKQIEIAEKKLLQLYGY